MNPEDARMQLAQKRIARLPRKEDLYFRRIPVERFTEDEILILLKHFAYRVDKAEKEHGIII